MKKKRKERSLGLSLTLIFAGVIMGSMGITAILVGLLMSALVRGGMLTEEATQFNTGVFLLFMVLYSLLIGSGIVFLTIRIPLKPIEKLLNALNRLAEGDYSVRLSFKGALSRHPITKNLTGSFNSMAEQLQETELLHSDFVNNFSHEFKTPIVSIAGFAKLLRKGNATEEQKQEYLGIIEEESLRLAQMSMNVLNMTRVENQNELTNVEHFNLSEQLRTSMLMLESKWRKKQLEPALPEEEYYIDGNEELLKEVWINLFDNAIKFSPEGGNINVEVTKIPEGMLVDVTNQGAPIPEDRKARIFDRFYQADESHATEGNGVGLAVVKRVVDLHKGSVSVQCADGKTTFSVFIPA